MISNEIWLQLVRVFFFWQRYSFYAMTYFSLDTNRPTNSDVTIKICAHCCLFTNFTKDVLSLSLDLLLLLETQILCPPLASFLLLQSFFFLQVSLGLLHLLCHSLLFPGQFLLEIFLADATPRHLILVSCLLPSVLLGVVFLVGLAGFELLGEAGGAGAAYLAWGGLGAVDLAELQQSRCVAYVGLLTAACQHLS